MALRLTIAKKRPNHGRTKSNLFNFRSLPDFEKKRDEQGIKMGVAANRVDFIFRRAYSLIRIGDEIK